MMSGQLGASRGLTAVSCANPEIDPHPRSPAASLVAIRWVLPPFAIIGFATPCYAPSRPVYHCRSSCSRFVFSPAQEETKTWFAGWA